MRLIIDIPEELFGKISDENYQSVISWYDTSLYCAIKNGTIYEERPQGEWVIEHDWVHCSSCGHEQNYPSDFCPKCGAAMEAKQDD